MDTQFEEMRRFELLDRLVAERNLPIPNSVVATLAAWIPGHPDGIIAWREGNGGASALLFGSGVQVFRWEGDDGEPVSVVGETVGLDDLHARVECRTDWHERYLDTGSREAADESAPGDRVVITLDDSVLGVSSIELPGEGRQGILAAADLEFARRLMAAKNRPTERR